MTSKGHNTVEIEIPGLLSFLAHSDFHSAVPGINNVAADEAARFGGRANDYSPNIPVAYWGFRRMIVFGMTSFALGLVGLWLTRTKRWCRPPTALGGRSTAADAHRRPRAGPGPHPVGLADRHHHHGLPADRQLLGWIFTEMGRQPWSVFGLMRTSDRYPPVSPPRNSSSP